MSPIEYSIVFFISSGKLKNISSNDRKHFYKEQNEIHANHFPNNFNLILPLSQSHDIRLIHQKNVW